MVFDLRALLSVLVAVQYVSAIGFRPPNYEKRQSNGARLALGMPLRKPRRIFQPSGTTHAERSEPSGVPFPIDTTQSEQTGSIGVLTTDGTLIGYFSLSSTSLASTPVKRGIMERDSPTHSFVTPSSSYNLFNIYITGDSQYNINAIAACDAILSPTSSNVITIGNVGIATAAGGRGVCTVGYSPEYQSDIWTIDLDTGRLHLHFVNPDLTTYDNYFTYNTGTYGGLRVTGNIELSETDSHYPLGNTVQEVYLYWGTVEDWNDYY
ncbi:hypothetical protein PUNSTDRAFT_121623 [Punctularia strigosozonata HHB-11173 SS5]|uniref:uncharacterized protein n=1 Tax=Punctularia strigosozonata (strain HHB-11173) TaxID=741275 RepID=UPI00044180E1|nr:uncharacterized protein PUNSTDRAFT_121623 [Punctularia strigosozonata HHB-11173 SS5]EIN06387.1 hypothetical protein PUNSTDRAFT_121623 [Punctularia strigosozonata HHB-11173 SS5]